MIYSKLKDSLKRGSFFFKNYFDLCWYYRFIW